jgi:thiamine biosynthesis lipoprotein
LKPGWKRHPAVVVVVIEFVALLSLGCVAPAGSPTPTRIAISDGWLAMGTFFEVEIRVLPGEADRARNWIEWAHQEIVRLEKIYSRHDPDSAISGLNRSLAREDAVTLALHVDSELESILFLAIEIWEGSGGAFDMTIGPLVDVWTGAVTKGSWPSIDQLRHAKARLGSEAFLLLGDGQLEVLTPGMRVDLDGLSKGRVLDQLRARFEKDLPDAAALLNFGESSIMAIGDPDGEGWRLSIRSRNPSDGSLSNGSRNVLRLRDQALSVSSSLGIASEVAGERISRVIDPRTGSAVVESVEAFVIADRAGMADGWSTALLVFGANRTAIRLIEKAGLEADILESSGRGVSTKGWEDFFVQP